jgi:hypothetical protein
MRHFDGSIGIEQGVGMKKRFKRLLMFVLVLCVLAGLYITYHQVSYTRSLDELRALGYPATMNELREWNRLDDSEENAAVPIHAALELFEFDFPDDLKLPITGDCCWREEYEGAYPDDVLTDIKVMLDANQEGLKLLHDSTHLTVYRYKINTAPFNSEHYGLGARFRAVSRFLVEETIYYAGVGELDKAIDAVETNIWLSRMMAQYPDVISVIIAEAMRGMGFGSVQQLVNKYDVSDAQLQRLVDITDPTVSSFDFKRNIIGEHVFDVDFVSYSRQFEIFLELEWNAETIFVTGSNFETYQLFAGLFTPKIFLINIITHTLSLSFLSS